ncbi:MAG: CBS domain-containing protein [Halobacteriales archaeon]|nr:CBS domain-containing protein [Halobacteriales archaeon]
MRQFRIGSVFGIPLKLDLTFLLVLPLFAWVIGSQVGLWADQLGRLGAPALDVAALTAGNMPWLLGIAAAVGLFAGVVLHELGHSLVAMRFGYPIESITLWLFGGIAKLKEMPEAWRQELAIAIAGPIVSVALGGLFWVAFIAIPTGLPALRFVVGYLALMNVALAGFNLLPAFPMDGGRVLRALLARNRPYARATKIAAEVGKGFALLLGLFGLLQVNIVLIGIAFFIYIGASGEAQQTVMKAAFEGVTVRDVMTPVREVDTVGPEMSVAELVETMFRQRHTGYPVIESESLVGLVTLEDAKEIKPVERDAFLVKEIMSRDLTTIDVDAEAIDAVTEMQSAGVGRLIVEEGGEFVGLITRSDLVTALNIIQSGGTVARDRTEVGRGPSQGVL